LNQEGGVFIDLGQNPDSARNVPTSVLFITAIAPKMLNELYYTTTQRSPSSHTINTQFV